MSCEQCVRAAVYSLKAKSLVILSSARSALPGTIRPPESPVQPMGIKLLLAARQFLLGWGPGQDAEHLVLLHDDEFFAVNLDLGPGVLAEQDAVAIFHCQREGLSVFVDAASADRHNFALLRLVFRRVGDDDAAARGGSFLHTAHQNAVMER